MAYLTAECLQDLLGDGPIGALEREGNRDRLGHESEPPGGAAVWVGGSRTLVVVPQQLDPLRLGHHVRHARLALAGAERRLQPELLHLAGVARVAGVYSAS